MAPRFWTKEKEASLFDILEKAQGGVLYKVLVEKNTNVKIKTQDAWNKLGNEDVLF